MTAEKANFLILVIRTPAVSKFAVAGIIVEGVLPM